MSTPPVIIMPSAFLSSWSNSERGIVYAFTQFISIVVSSFSMKFWYVEELFGFERTIVTDGDLSFKESLRLLHAENVQIKKIKETRRS